MKNSRATHENTTALEHEFDLQEQLKHLSRSKYIFGAELIYRKDAHSVCNIAERIHDHCTNFLYIDKHRCNILLTKIREGKSARKMPLLSYIFHIYSAKRIGRLFGSPYANSSDKRARENITIRALVIYSSRARSRIKRCESRLIGDNARKCCGTK